MFVHFSYKQRSCNDALIAVTIFWLDSILDLKFNSFYYSSSVRKSSYTIDIISINSASWWMSYFILLNISSILK